jgi:hypothetical protein
MENNQDLDKGPDYKSFAFKRMVVAIILIIGAIWALSAGLKYINKPDTDIPGSTQAVSHKASPAQALVEHTDVTTKLAAGSGPPITASAQNIVKEQAPENGPAVSDGHQQPTASQQTNQTHAPTAPKVTVEPKPTGVAFVEAIVEPIEYELKKRFWGWRPNDIANVTDNINYFQLGVLEVTRRATVQLAERISRTGSTDSFNRHLENAMNGLMINADRFWFPSPESKYKESLESLETYRKQLLAGKASFYTRADNLIPLLAAFEDLLGSCDENLVKTKEADGSSVGFFTCDNYFYYAKGVASAMVPILKAVHHDFTPMLDSRHGSQLLHHALLSCQRAASLNPWLVTNSSLDGILANHRANMAAPISHARFFIGQLIKTLST